MLVSAIVRLYTSSAASANHRADIEFQRRMRATQIFLLEEPEKES
jgi:hypothetical protein